MLIKFKSKLLLITFSFFLISTTNSNTIRECEIDESFCPPNTHPYTCVEGINYGGCSPLPTNWPSFGCNNQCKNTIPVDPNKPLVRLCLPNESDCYNDIPYT